MREVLRRLYTEQPPTAPPPATILDLGCGTGVAGAAWALALADFSQARPPTILGCDANDWAVAEARHTFANLGLRGGALRTEIARLRWPKGPLAAVAAFTINELPPAQRQTLQKRLLDEAAAGGQVLVLEPLARPITKAWWDDWAAVFKKHGGRADEWHFDLPLPERMHVLGKAAGLNPRELGARTLWLAR